MLRKSNSTVLRTVPVLLAACLAGLPAQAKYSGGTGSPNDPYQIATAADLITLGESTGDYGKNFILTADIDLDPNLPGRKVFDKAVIAPNTSPSNWSFGETSFTGVFDGKGHWLHNYRGSDALFGKVDGFNAEVKNLGLVRPVVVGVWHRMVGWSLLVETLKDGTVSNCDVQDCRLFGVFISGGLVCSNGGTITNCHISGQVSTSGHFAGGLVGFNSADGTIIYCSFSGSVHGSYRGGGAGGLVGRNHGGISFCYSTGLVSGGYEIGGLVGNNYKVISNCYSTSNVSVSNSDDPWLPVASGPAAGLVGVNSGIINNCYSTGTAHGDRTVKVGGLVGTGSSVVTGCFWDTQTSGQATSDGGTGKTTAEMQTAKTFLDAGWDFMGETTNGVEDIWWIDEGRDYPRLVWEFPVPGDGAREVSRSPILRWVPRGRDLQCDVYLGEDEAAVASATPASPGIYRGRRPAEMPTYEPGSLVWCKSYYWRIDEVNQTDPNRVWKGEVWSFTVTDAIVSHDPADGATAVIQSPVLRWRPAGPGLQYDVYLGEARDSVANATTVSPGVYRGRQAAEVTAYTPLGLKWGTTYYWRIDAVDEADPSIAWKGNVWSFATADLVVAVVDDFESYTDDKGSRLYQTWLPGWANGTNSWVGNVDPPFAEQRIVHGGKQSMPMEYYNDTEPWYSEAERSWQTPQDWTINGTETLTLYSLGQAGNSRDPLYVAIEDSGGRIAVVAHPDPNAVLAMKWQKWHIALADLRMAGVDLGAVKKMAIGVGDRNSSKPGGIGRIYIDDIRLTKRMP